MSPLFLVATLFMEQNELIPHLFRTEYSKIIAVLCKQFGIHHIEIAEDIAADTFLSAVENWSYKGLPANPTAWLYTVAKNKAKNYFAHFSVLNDKIKKEISHTAEQPVTEIDLSNINITDSQLRMLFAVCHPCISGESQVCLALRVLCGFGIDEIANAFLTSSETINKRLSRAKEKLRNENIPIELPSANEINDRLESVTTTLYLLFSEGYYSENNNAVLRKDLCLEAMRLTYMLVENPQTNQPFVNALLSLMCFHASRFEARVNENNELIFYQDQDETLWNRDLISKGVYFFKQSSQGNSLSRFHLEAGIAFWHTIKTDSKEKWENILQLYNKLLQLKYSPVAALNRTYALSKVNGKDAAIAEAEKINLASSPYYYTLLGELYKESDSVKAKLNFLKAMALAKTAADLQIIQRQLDTL